MNYRVMLLNARVIIKPFERKVTKVSPKINDNVAEYIATAMTEVAPMVERYWEIKAADNDEQGLWALNSEIMQKTGLIENEATKLQHA